MACIMAGTDDISDERVNVQGRKLLFHAKLQVHQFVHHNVVMTCIIMYCRTNVHVYTGTCTSERVKEIVIQYTS